MLFNTKLLVLNSKKVMEDNRHTIIIGNENEIVIKKKKVGVQHDLLNNTTCYKCSALKQAIIKTEL